MKLRIVLLPGSQSTLTRPVVGDREEVARRLHGLTRGVPLAVRALLDLHEAGGDLFDGHDEEEEPLDEGAAVRKVVETVACRMLYHLSLERRPEREDHGESSRCQARRPAV